MSLFSPLITCFDDSSSCLLHSSCDVARAHLCPAASCRPHGIRSLSSQSRRAVPSSCVLGAEDGAREGVREEHPRLRVLHVHPRQSWQRPADLWPLRGHTPLPLHQPTDWSVCIRIPLFIKCIKLRDSVLLKLAQIRKVNESQNTSQSLESESTLTS